MADDPSDLDELRGAAARAREVASMLTELGGVVSLADLPDRWGITYATASAHSRRADFPAPWQEVGESRLWLAAEVDLWRAKPRRQGRPPKRAAG